MRDLKIIENLVIKYLEDGNIDLDGPNRQGTCVDEENPTIYVSIPSDAGWQLPNLPSGWFWGQVTKMELQKMNGRGWLPLNLEKYAAHFRLKSLAIDPLNTADPLEGKKNFFYAYVCHRKNKKFELVTKMESLRYGVDYFGASGTKDVAFRDGVSSLAFMK